MYINNLDRLQCSVKLIKKNEKYIEKYIKYMAKLNRAYFVELIRQGFEENQAFELLKLHGLELFPK